MTAQGALRLLIVHPEPKVAAALRAVGEEIGYEVTTLPDGERAIDRFVLSPFDVIVVEYFLPGRDGVTTVESIRWAPRGREVRVVLLAESEPEIAPLTALGARIDAIETLVGSPTPESIQRALVRARTTHHATETAPAMRAPPIDFEDQTNRGPLVERAPQPSPVPSKTMATRFDDESTVQGSAGVARAMLGPWTPGMTPPGTSPGLMPGAKVPSLLQSSPDAAPKLEASSARPLAAPEGDGTRVARRGALPDVGTTPEKAGEWRRDAGAIAEARAVEDEARRAAPAAVSGRFENKPFPEIITELAEAKATGALVCKQDEAGRRETTTGDAATKIVYFRAGAPTHVRSNLLDECLGQLLLRKKRIGRATLEESIRRTLAGEGLQGEILIDMGALSPVEVSETLATQATEKLYDLFGWRRGTFRFVPGEGREGGLAIEQALADIVYEGVCAAMPATQLLDLLTPHLEAFVVPDAQRLARFARVRLPSELRPVLAKIDGRVPLRTVLGAGGRPGAVAQMVYALFCLKAVRFEDAAHARGPQKVTEESDVGPAPVRGRAPAGLLPMKPAPDADWDETTAQQGRKSSPELTPAPREVPPVHQVPSEILARLTAPSVPPPAPAPPAAPPPAAAMPDGPDTAPSERPRGPELDQKVDRLFEAERHFRRGSRALERQRYDEALSAFVRAHELVPTEGEFLAYVGWSRFAIDAANETGHELALTELAQAADLSPDLYVTHLLYARVLSRLRRDGEARRAYERVLALEPNNAEARAALGR